MKKVGFSFIVFAAMALISCGGEESSTSNNDKQNSEANNINCLDFAIAEKYQTLDPIKVTDVVSFHVVSQIYEPLLRFDEKDLSLQPLLAEYWQISEDNLVHTFQLKKGVYFHDNACFEGGKGRELKAADVIYSFKRIFSDTSANYALTLFNHKIVGVDEFKESGGDIAGLKALDDYTIEITLTKPSSNFMNLLATTYSAIIPHESIEKNVIVGTGPFVYNKEKDTKTAIVLLKNNNYHMTDKKRNRLPYIDAVAFNYVKKGQEQLDLFMEDKLDVITDIPPESIKEIVEAQIADFQDKPVKYVLGRYPQISTSYLNLNNAIAPFNNINIRKAIGMAINKTRIVDDVLKGEAFGSGDHGFVSPAIKNYDFSSIIGQEYNVSKAKEILVSEGYPGGKGFPTLKFATGKSNTNLRVALEIQKQLLANLNINVEISSLSLVEIINMNNKSEIHLSLDGWLGEFPDPVNFLSLFYGGYVSSTNTESSFPNASRYKNAEFDKLYEQALITTNAAKRYELCLTADQIIASDVPVIPLWYHENYQLIQSTVKNYQPNSMDIQYLTHVKIVEPPSEKKH